MKIKLINKLIKYFYFYNFFISSKKIKKLNFNNLNFKNVDFINYKKIKTFYYKDNFILIKNNKETHYFDFINYSTKIGGKSSIDLSKKNLFTWYSNNKLKLNILWENEFLSKRLINIIYNYEFLNSLSKKSETYLLNKIIYVHIKQLVFDFKNKSEIDLSISEVKAFLLINFYFNKKYLNNFKKIEKFLDSHIDKLGVHKSYNLLIHSKFINDLYEIKNIFLFFNKNLPEKITILILRMTTH